MSPVNLLLPNVARFTLRVLREVGVDYAQGFGIDRPRHLDDDTPFPMAVELADTLAAGP